MPFCSLTALVCLAAFALQLAESQELLSAPTLTFRSDVNQSAIKLYSSIQVVCTIPVNANIPVNVYLSKENASAYLDNIKIWRKDPVTFTLKVSPENETALVCWYGDTRSRSNFSNPINVAISALFEPIAVLFPQVFPVGAKYTVQCETPQTGYINTTVSVYDRLLPIQPGKESFNYISSRVLAPGEWGGAITLTNTGEAYEFQCEISVFLNGRTLHSRSNIAAIPEELPVQLVPKYSGSGTCYGDAFLKVRDDWRPLCFSSRNYQSFMVASVICRDLGCGPAIDVETNYRKPQDAIGTPNCTGAEKKVAECPLSSANLCNQGTITVICSEAFPPPILSVSEHESASRVYVTSEESVTLSCIFYSSAVDNAYITFTRNGVEIYTTRARSGYREILSEPVTKGEYACYGYIQSSVGIYKTKTGNVMGIYIYNPPPAGAIAAGVITTFLGVLILVLLCTCRASG